MFHFVSLQMTLEHGPPHPQEQPGRTISLDVSSDSYLLFEDKKFVVKAFRLFHRIPSFGFCVQEHDRPGRLKTELLKELGTFIIVKKGKRQKKHISSTSYTL